MKKKYFLFDFFEIFIIFFTFILPSILIESQKEVFIDINFPFIAIILRILVSIYLIMRLYDTGMLEKNMLTTTKKSLLILVIQSIVLYIFLLLTGTVFNILTLNMPNMSFLITALPPQTIAAWLWFVLSVIILACFEEILFRFYLPKKLLKLLTDTKPFAKISSSSKVLYVILLETIIVILFALGHRYLGTFAVLSACISGIFLRFFVKKFKTIIPACIAHSINNIASFLLVFYLVEGR